MSRWPARWKSAKKKCFNQNLRRNNISYAKDRHRIEPCSRRGWNSGGEEYERSVNWDRWWNPYPKMAVVNDTWSIWRKTSRPNVETITAAMWIPPAPTWTLWNRTSIITPTSDAYQGMRRSMIWPPTGPMATPAMPNRPKRPITNLRN